jgi:hypothetical protein
VIQPILDGRYVWSLFASYDEHDMLENDEEKEIGGRKKIDT